MAFRYAGGLPIHYPFDESHAIVLVPKVADWPAARPADVIVVGLRGSIVFDEFIVQATPSLFVLTGGSVTTYSISIIPLGPNFHKNILVNTIFDQM